MFRKSQAQFRVKLRKVRLRQNDDLLILKKRVYECHEDNDIYAFFLSAVFLILKTNYHVDKIIIEDVLVTLFKVMLLLLFSFF